MANDPRAQLQKIIDGRPKAGAGAASATAETTNSIANFQDWLFFGTEPDIFVNVGIVPASGSIAITYALVVFETPNGYIVGNATVGTSNAQAGWTLNLALSIDNYSIQQFGSQINAWAYAEAYVGGHPQGEYSAIQNYTVNS